MELKNTYKALDEFGDKVVERARFNLKLKGFGGQKRNRNKDASGKLSRSLGHKITDTSSGKELSFTSSTNYAGFVEEGRRKGAYTPIAPLKKWIKDKRLRLQKTVKTAGVATKAFTKINDKSITSAAIAISKSNKKTGIPAVPFFGEALDYVYDEEEPKIQEALATDLEDLIFKDFEKNGSNS